MSHFVITIDSRIASCVPIPPAGCESLQYVDQSLEYRNGKSTWRRSKVRLHVTEKDGSLSIPAGSVSRLVAELQKLGHEVTISDRRTLHPVVRGYDADFYSQLVDRQRRLADLIIAKQQFILATAPKVASEAMGLVTRLYPDARFFVAVVNKAACDSVIIELSKYVGGNVGRAIGLGCDAPERVAVGTYAQFAVSNPAESHIVLFPNAEHAITKQISDGIAAYENQRVYGFIGSARPKLTMRQLLHLEMHAGPLITDWVDFSTNTPQPKVVFCDSRASTIRIPNDPLGRKRVGIWRNEVRNQLIADIAQAFADGDENELWSHFRVRPDLADIIGSLPRCVTILVESLEHGRLLSALLPGWDLVSAIRNDPALSIGRHSRTIVTMAAANKCRELIADVFIRTDCGQDGTCWPITAPQGIGQRLVVVDFVDDMDLKFLADTRLRAIGYSAQGFDVACPNWLIDIDINDAHSRRQCGIDHSLQHPALIRTRCPSN